LPNSAAVEDLNGSGNSKREQLFRERLDRLAAQLGYLAFVARAEDARDLGDAVIGISLLDRNGQAQDAVVRLAGMYQEVARRGRMTAEVLGEFYNARQDRVYLLISGLGAYGLLKNESGLHQVERRYKERAARSAREVIREDRELLRVETLPASGQPSQQFQRHVKSKISAVSPVRQRLLKNNLAVTLFHEPSVRSLEFWTTGSKEEALERGFLVLSAHVAGGSDVGGGGIVRQYDVGMAAKVKDYRTGRTTSRVDQVFKGDLRSLWDPESEMDWTQRGGDAATEA
jgi:hypothetical protein